MLTGVPVGQSESSIRGAFLLVKDLVRQARFEGLDSVGLDPVVYTDFVEGCKVYTDYVVYEGGWLDGAHVMFMGVKVFPIVGVLD